MSWMLDRTLEYKPLRLFDCLGLGGPSTEAAGADCLRTGAFFVDCLRAFLATGGWSSRGRGGLGLRRRKTEGEGIWMSSAMSLCLPLAVLLRNRTLSMLSVHMSQDYETVVPRQRKACVGGKVS